MAAFEWSDEYSVGIDMIDKQHMVLVRLINLLAMAIESKGSDELLGAIFETLADYTLTHFEYEEEMFETAGYEDSEAHKKKHKILLAQVTNLKSKWESGEAEMGQEVLTFLVNWLRNHILVSDMEYVAAVKGGPVNLLKVG